MGLWTLVLSDGPALCFYCAFIVMSPGLGFFRSKIYVSSANPVKVSFNLKSVSFSVCSHRLDFFLYGLLMLGLSKCPATLRWTLPLRCSTLPLRSATPSQRSTTTGPQQFLRTQTALFHQSEAKASPELNKPSTGKNTQPAAFHH